MINRTTIAACLLAALLLLSGCEVLQHRPGNGQDAERAAGEPLFGFRRGPAERRVGRLVEYHADLSTKDDAELEREIVELRQGLEEDICTDIRLRLGIAELVRGGNTGPELLAPCLNDSGQPPLVTQFAHLVQGKLDQQRSQARALAVLHRRLEEQRKENMELRRQLDGLKAIERSLQRRDRSPME